MKYIILLIVIVFLSGCSYTSFYSPVTREKMPAEYKHVGVYLLDNEIEIVNKIDVDADYGAKRRAEWCLSAAKGGSGIGIIFVIPCLPIAAVIGAEQGRAEEYKLDAIKKEHGSVRANIDVSHMKQHLQKTMLSYVRSTMPTASCIKKEDVQITKDGSIDYSTLHDKGIDTVVEYKIVKITLDEFGFEDVPMFVALEVDSRLIKTKDNFLVDKYSMIAKSGLKNYGEWVHDDFLLLKSELYEMLSRVVTDSIDEYFLLYYPTFGDDINKTKRAAPFYVLAPYYPMPELVFASFREEVLGRPTHVFREIDEQRPLIKWEAFPWKYDVLEKGRFSDISYDLKIYEYPGLLVYKRIGLEDNEHLVEEELKKGTKYLWTVRARFKVDDKFRVTEWSGLYNHYTPPWEYDTSWMGRRNPLYKKADYYPFEIKEE